VVQTEQRAQHWLPSSGVASGSCADAFDAASGSMNTTRAPHAANETSCRIFIAVTSEEGTAATRAG
jgi:hypothetical protein